MSIGPGVGLFPMFQKVQETNTNIKHFKSSSFRNPLNTVHERNFMRAQTLRQFELHLTHHYHSGDLT